MDDMKYLRLTAKEWAGYSGPIGVVWFKDGVSTEPWQKHVRDRVSSAIPMEEFTDDGDVQEAGQAADSLRNRLVRVENPAPLKRQTVDGKVAEMVKTVLGNVPKRTLRSQDELEAIIAAKGIAGLREVAAEWNVKGKSIPDLLEAISRAQNSYSSTHLVRSDALREKYAEAYGQKTESTGSDDALTSPVTEKPKRGRRKNKEIAEAAATGDLAAALITDEPAPLPQAVVKDEVPAAELVGDWAITKE